MNPVGLIGMGLMGSSAAHNLARNGTTLVVFDVDERKRADAEAAGYIWAGSTAAVAAQCSVVLVSLPGPDNVIDAVCGTGGLAEGWGDASLTDASGVAGDAGKYVVDLSTIGPDAARTLHAYCAERGEHYVEAAIAGNPDQTRAGVIKLLVSGDQGAVAQLDPLLMSMSVGYQFLGGPGAGQEAKLALNAIQGAFLAGVSENLAQLVSAGVDLDAFLDIAVSMDYQEWIARTVRAWKNDSYDFGFSINLLAKDLRLAQETHERANSTATMTVAARALFERAQAHGVGHLNLAALTKVLIESDGSAHSEASHV